MQVESLVLDDALVSIFETGNCINFDQNGSSKKITPLRSIICHLEEYIIREYITIVQFHILYTLLVMDLKVPEIGFSGIRNQLKNGLMES